MTSPGRTPRTASHATHTPARAASEHEPERMHACVVLLSIRSPWCTCHLLSPPPPGTFAVFTAHIPGSELALIGVRAGSGRPATPNPGHIGAGVRASLHMKCNTLGNVLGFRVRCTFVQRSRESPSLAPWCALCRIALPQRAPCTRSPETHLKFPVTHVHHQVVDSKP